MWVEKKCDELPIGTKFKLYSDREEHTLIRIDNHLYGLRPDYTAYSLLNFNVLVEAPTLKFKDVKAGQMFQFMDDIKHGCMAVYLMTNKPKTTVITRSAYSVGQLTEWHTSDDEEVQLVEKGE